jgi:hypothetical protein
VAKVSAVGEAVCFPIAERDANSVPYSRICLFATLSTVIDHCYN